MSWVRDVARNLLRRAQEPVSARAAEAIRQIRSNDLTYCGPPKLENIAEAMDFVERDKVPGSIIEAGVALGGSAILLARLKPADRTLHLYDVFRMIPPPGENDGQDAHARYDIIRSGTSAGLGGKVYYGYVDNLLEAVKENLRSFGITEQSNRVVFHVGLFQDTLHPAEPVAFAHIDADWYDSVTTCIERIAPLLSPGGIMIFDDYSSYEGCRRAVDQFLARNKEFRVLFHRRSLAVRRAGPRSS